jgi:hypothetical protein
MWKICHYFLDKYDVKSHCLNGKCDRIWFSLIVIDFLGLGNLKVKGPWMEVKYFPAFSKYHCSGILYHCFGILLLQIPSKFIFVVVKCCLAITCFSHSKIGQLGEPI